MRLLLLDDDTLLIESLRRLLTRARPHWTVRYATTSDEAVAHMRDTDIDVVFSDLMMPDVSGEAFLRLARHLAPSAVRVIASGAIDYERFPSLVGIAHRAIDKPFSLGELTALLQSIEESCAEASPSERALLLSELDLAVLAKTSDVALRESVWAEGSVHGREWFEQVSNNPWRCALAMHEASTAPVSGGHGAGDLVTTLKFMGLNRFAALAHGEPTRSEVTFSWARIVDVARRSAARAALTRHIGRDLLAAGLLSTGSFALAQSASVLGMIAGTVVPHGTPMPEIARLSARALALRGFQQSVVEVVRDAQVDAASTSTVAEWTPADVVAVADLVLDGVGADSWPERLGDGVHRQAVERTLTGWQANAACHARVAVAA